MSATSTPRPLRYLLFGTELYAIPILRPLQAAIRARGGEARWFLHGQDSARHLDTDEIAFTRASEVQRYAPDVVLCAANWVPEFFAGTKVQVFHGFNVEKRDQAHGHFRIRGMFDLYCTQGPHTTVPFQALAEQHGYFRVAQTGWPKLDPLFGDADPAADAIRAAAAGRPVIGFGSTFTERLSCAPHLADTIEGLIAKGEHYWALTLHPRCPPGLFDRYRGLQGANACFVEPVAMLSLLRAADVLVADTSSILSEFAVQRRPVVTFRCQAPKPHMLDIQHIDQLRDAVQRAVQPDADWRQRIQAYADAIHPDRDGRSSARVLDAVDAFRSEGWRGLARKPWNPWRRLQARWRLSYFLP
jgi:CDP-glycerol glycerophosphotransferase (TagB/SpsB family)